MTRKIACHVYLLFPCILLAASSVAQQPSLPFPFEDTVVLDGLEEPTTVQFTADGRVFVAEKSGLVKLFDSLDDPTPEIVVDLRTPVSSFWDRGLLGLALHPTQPFLYLLYTYDAPPGQQAPVWNDQCPTPPGATQDGCVVSARLSRFALGPTGRVLGSEEVLLEDGWCQQFPSHSIGTAVFGNDGALYVGAGDGASFNTADYGQLGGTLPATPTLSNPCGDPPVPVGGTQTPPTAEGGALRSQDLLTAADPVSYAGTLLRLDPDTGAALPDNPLFGGVPDDDRIIAHGLRNPYRFTVRPATDEIWIGDVGWTSWEEINRIVDPVDAVVENFGWPCWEGELPQPSYEGLALDLCAGLYAGTGAPGTVLPPYFAYAHGQPPDPEQCGPGFSAAISGLAFYTGASYPFAYHGALLFADYSRHCIWAMLLDAGGDPDPDNLITLVAGAGTPVDLRIGPGGDLFYVDLPAGALHRVAVIADYIFGDGFESGDLAAWLPPPL